MNRLDLHRVMYIYIDAFLILPYFLGLQTRIKNKTKIVHRDKLDKNLYFPT